jgi:mannose-6-phosphate isomerase-like protein (cupin superfamily)
MYNNYDVNQCYFLNNNIDYYNLENKYRNLEYIKDQGNEPFVLDIEEASKSNNAFRRAIWTGEHLQVTLMNIKPGESIGLELHSDVDQFVRIEDGVGIIKMGDTKQNLNFEKKVYEDFAFVIPAGKWHDLINVGNKPLKLYSIYAPPQHAKGTIDMTKEDDKH